MVLFIFLIKAGHGVQRNFLFSADCQKFHYNKLDCTHCLKKVSVGIFWSRWFYFEEGNLKYCLKSLLSNLFQSSCQGSKALSDSRSYL